MQTEIKRIVTDFIVTNFLFGDEQRLPGEEESLIDKGIIDSTGILELIGFLESTFEIQIADTETVPRNLDSIGNLMRFVSEKQAAKGEVNEQRTERPSSEDSRGGIGRGALDTAAPAPAGV